MKIALAQINIRIGDLAYNAAILEKYSAEAREKGADIIAFPELSLTGYTPKDLLEFDEFLRETQDKIAEIARKTQGITVILGAPAPNPDPLGKNLFNAGYVLADGKIQDIVYKSLLPTYDVFDEYRYFESSREFHCIEVNGKKIALVICEDTWDIDPDPLYTIHPMDKLIQEKPELILNISASPFSYKHPENRKNMLKWNTERFQIPMLYVNQIGGHADIIFDGGSMVYHPQQGVLLEMEYFKEDLQIFDTENFSKRAPEIRSKIQNIHDALVCGIRDYFSKLGFQQAVLGLSGGIDSALTAALAAEALGKENVTGILMPSAYSSEHSIDDAVQLAENLGMQYLTVPIGSIYNGFATALQPVFSGKKEDVTEENLQARIRGTLLMAYSNKFGPVVLNTSNKSEAAVGYGTLYGDMCGGLAVLGDVYKMQVYELANYINRNGEIIPKNSISKAPSAELRPNQTDQDSLPPYDLLDAVLFDYIEGSLGPEDLIKKGHNRQLVERIVRLVNLNEYKRYQTPPILRVSPKAFGPGRKMPLVGRYFTAKS